MKQFLSVFSLLLLILPGTSAEAASNIKPDPVTLTFAAEAGSLKMELGLIRAVWLEPVQGKFLIWIKFETEGVKLYNRFAYRYPGLSTDVFICKEKVFTYTAMPYLEDDSVRLPVEYEKAEAESVMDELFYGESCENYL